MSGRASHAATGSAERLVAEIRWLRHQLACSDALRNPSVYAELNELYTQVWSVQEQRAGKHRLAAQAGHVRAPVRDAAGFDLRPDPLTAATNAELVARLRQYRQWAGDPPFRAIAAQAGQIVAHSTIYVALNSDELPSLKVVLAVVAGCGGSEEDQRAFATAWRRLKAATPEPDRRRSRAGLSRLSCPPAA